MAVKNFSVMDFGKAGLLEPEHMGYNDSLEIIQDESMKLQKSFVKIGWYLKHIRDNELYREDGYINIYECATDKLGYSQSTTSRFIKICEKFSKNGNSPELDEKYAGFDKSQMIEMLPMEQEEIERVTSDMTVTEIRAVKNERIVNKPDDGKVKEEPETTENDLPGQTSIEKNFPEYLPQPTPEESGTHNLDEDKYASSCVNGEINIRNSIPEEESENDSREEKIIDAEYREISEGAVVKQPEFPILKNNEQRAEWLKNYKNWGMWYRDENIDVNYYKFDFANGSRLIVAEYPQRDSYYSNQRQDECFFHLLEKNKKGYEKTYDESYRHKPDSMTYLIDFLQNIQKKFH